MDCFACYMRPIWCYMRRVDMDCIACYMRRIWHLKTRVPHAKSPTLQRCHTDSFASDRHGTSYAPYVTSKDAFTASKEPYSAEVWNDLIVWHVSLVSPGLQCVAVCCSVLRCVALCCTVLCRVCWFMRDVSLLSRMLQCVAVCCSALQSGVACDAECCNVLQCVAVCCSVF